MKKSILFAAFAAVIMCACKNASMEFILPEATPETEKVMVYSYGDSCEYRIYEYITVDDTSVNKTSVKKAVITRKAKSECEAFAIVYVDGERKEISSETFYMDTDLVRVAMEKCLPHLGADSLVIRNMPDLENKDWYVTVDTLEAGETITNSKKVIFTDAETGFVCAL